MERGGVILRWTHACPSDGNVIYPEYLDSTAKNAKYVKGYNGLPTFPIQPGK
jgi:hypothetical protein